MRLRPFISQEQTVTRHFYLEKKSTNSSRHPDTSAPYYFDPFRILYVLSPSQKLKFHYKKIRRYYIFFLMWETISFPGLRKQIFNGTWWDEETDDYVLETGIGVREYQVGPRLLRLTKTKIFLHVGFLIKVSKHTPATCSSTRTIFFAGPFAQCFLLIVDTVEKKVPTNSYTVDKVIVLCMLNACLLTEVLASDILCPL